jgi:hypothetical protein
LKNHLKHKQRLVTLAAMICMIAATTLAWAQEQSGSAVPASLPEFKLEQAAMCEDIKDYLPYHTAVVFSLEIGKVYCFTSFSGISNKMYIFHDWYRQDRLITTKRLLLQPPEWGTYSSIQLREADKGPWRVELKDEEGKVLKVLRFSITD